MEQGTPIQPPTPVQLVALASELGVPVEEVERELTPKNIFRSAAGFQSCTSYSANRLVEKYAARKAEAEAEAKRASEEAKAQHEAARARAIADRANPESRVQQFGLQMMTVSPQGPEGVPAVIAMTSKANDHDFDGGTMTRRPSRLDWLTGKGEGGSSIGPSRKQMEKAAAARKAERLAAKQQPKNKKGI
jgi:hypothetical protein